MLTFQILGIVLLVRYINLVKLSRRVVSGTDATIKSFPYLVSIRNKFGSHFCGGSIVTANYALTAAHCTNLRKADDLSIQYGVTNINVNGPNVVRVERIIQHKGFMGSAAGGDDISLLEVEHPFPIDNKMVACVRLPMHNFETPQNPEGAPGVLAGWGLNATGGIKMNHLQAVNLKIYSNDECESRHKNGDVTQNQLCGGVDEGGKGQCNGDSGGPLFYKEKNKLTQVGIASWSYKPCGRMSYPGVFTKVSKYSNWMLEKMWRISINNNTIFCNY